MIKAVNISNFVSGGIRANHRSYPLPKNLTCFGADTETVKGEPVTLQMFDGKDLLFKWVNRETILKEFIDFTVPRTRSRGVNIVYFHNLQFDAVILFYKYRQEIYKQGSEINFVANGFDVKMLFGKVNKITMKKGDVKIDIFDSKAFTQNWFEKSLKMFDIPFRKHKKPKGLGDILLVTSEFIRYAKRDVIAQYHLGRKILEFHEKYKIRPSISLPQFASRVFRHHFFKSDEVIPFPPGAVLKASELAYHGGKNGYNHPTENIPTVDNRISDAEIEKLGFPVWKVEPRRIDNAYEVDISSAFPHAMAELPQMIKGDYCRTNEYLPGYCGVYKVSGFQKAKYPVVYNHDFTPVLGSFKDLWITGYEVDCALKSPDVRLDSVSGWVWIPDMTYTHNPLRDYVLHFYALKEKTPKTDPNYHFYKILLNALYGKFVQTTEIRRVISKTEDDANLAGSVDTLGANFSGKIDYVFNEATKQYQRIHKEWRAGGMYNPFIAGQITGHARAHLWRLETKYNSFHSATDAVKTTQKIKATPGLGGIKIETFGRCYVFRNKCYLHFAKSTEFCGHDLKKIKHFDDDGQHLCKIGLHGYQGSVSDLFKERNRILTTREFTYKFKHMTGLREGTRRRETIAHMVERKATMKV